MGIAGANISRQEMHGVAHRFSHPAASPGQVVADIIPVPVPTSKICMMIDDRLGDRGFLESALDEENRIQTVPFQLVTEHGGYSIPRRGLCRGRGWAMHPTLVRRPHLQVHTRNSVSMRCRDMSTAAGKTHVRHVLLWLLCLPFSGICRDH